MIINFIVNVVLGAIQAIFSILPSAPATPSAVSSGGTWVTDTITDVISFFRMIFTGTLLDAALIIIVAIFTFPLIYKTVMWILRKIPMISVN